MSVFVIAEAGVNHNGSLEVAKKLVDAAKDAEADCIKFQTFVTKNLVSKNADKAEYQKKMTPSDEKQFEMLKKLELSFDDFIEIQNYCFKKNIEFLSTPFDLDSIDFLEKIGIERWKIPSGEITNLPYLIKIAQTGKPIIMSTGMSTLEEVGFAIELLKNNGAVEISILHCTTEYPAPFDEVNLNAMLTMKEKFGLAIGYSDHTKGIEIPIAAVALGATIVEKHFTLDKNMEGPDHKASLEPNELKAMIEGIRNVEVAMGNGDKCPTATELKNKEIGRKSIVAKCDIKQGEILSEDNLAIKRPGMGISPMRWYEVIGTPAVRSFVEDEPIEVEEK